MREKRSWVQDWLAFLRWYCILALSEKVSLAEFFNSPVVNTSWVLEGYRLKSANLGIPSGFLGGASGKDYLVPSQEKRLIKRHPDLNWDKGLSVPCLTTTTRPCRKKVTLRIILEICLIQSGLLPCLPNNLSTYGARRFHISRSEWDRVFSRLTVVPARSSFACSLRPLRSGFEPPNRQSELSGSVSFSKPCVGWGKRHFHREGFNPATGSPTATLLRLHPVEDPTVVCANKPTKSLCGTSVTQKSWVIIGPMLRAKPIPRV
ncbi:UNVERIFIED_CONTAM: hypothetical protein Scaly_3080600 [Sesamum calycinum]|uniref:Uncharacterized protein n=1 Tax=Sesamum calycinum TaxID=2727403 RepID=A0AAW2JUB1_9LAMI